MQEIVVESWAALQDALFHDAWDEKLERFRPKYAFRGLSDASYRLETRLIRLGGAYAELERHLLRNFRKYAHRDFLDSDSVWHWMAVAQHYGLPTRFLDWTHSPYVALHFATSDIDKFDCDGCIWAVNYAKAHLMLPHEFKRVLMGEGASVFTVEMLSKAVTSLDALDTFGHRLTLFVEPPSLDERIVNQFALFSLVSDPAAVLDDWLTGHPDLWWRIIIPAHLKWEIRDKLDQANITERVLFPGLDGLSRWLTRHYSPKKDRG